MTISRRAAWLGGCAIALVPQITNGNTSQTRLTIGATVVAPCRIGVVRSPSCASNQARPVSLVTKEGQALNPPAALVTQADDRSKSLKFTEVSF